MKRRVGVVVVVEMKEMEVARVWLLVKRKMKKGNEM